MNRHIVTTGLLVLLVVLIGCEPETSRLKEIAVDFSDVRVGTYNTRAIAVAWVRSDEFDRKIRSVMDECQKARDTGDTKRMNELKATTRAGQDRVHQQTFGDAPIPDIMARLKDDLPKIARKNNVQVIVAQDRYEGPPATFVDVTDQLVEQFHPTQETRDAIRKLLKHPPVKGPIHCR